MGIGRATALLVGVALWAVFEPSVGRADLGEIGKELTEVEAATRRLSAEKLRRSALRSRTYVEERLSDGELFYRLQDYVRASVIFTDIVDSHPRHRAFPDALYLLSDSLFRAGDYLGSRTQFRKIIERADETAFRPYVQRALGRLIEIAIRTRDFDGVEDYFQKLSQLPPQEIEAATAYFRAKYLYNVAVPPDDAPREGSETALPPVNGAALEEARVAFEAVAPKSPFAPQANYFIGVIHTLRSEFPAAIERFQKALLGDPDSPEHRSIATLAHLALGRVYYETNQLEAAASAYQSVPRTSAAFDTALYEIAWVYIRMDDALRAERALEVLSIASPESRYIPDAKLLRGNLLLRNGKFRKAISVFRNVRAQFVPIKRELAEMIAKHEDPAAYFRSLVRTNLDTFDANAFLPEEAQRWASFEGEMERAVTMLGDLSLARRLVAETSDLVVRLDAALRSPNRANVFADLRRHRERNAALRNRIHRIRAQLLAYEERSMPRGKGGELANVRTRRREIERLLGSIPTSEEHFVVRDDRVIARYRTLERSISEAEVQLLGLEARVTATDRYLRDSGANAATDEGLPAIRAELDTHREGIEAYRARIAELKRAIEAGRLQVGVGDARYVRDDRLREEYEQLVEKERHLLHKAGVRKDASVDRAYARLVGLERALERHDAAVDAVVDARIAEMRRVIDDESMKLEGYRAALAAVEGETEEVVGGITYANFERVRKRFHDLVLRSDVGRVDVAWARREEHRMRVDMLSRERSRELQALEDEFREIMDEGGAAEDAR